MAASTSFLALFIVLVAVGVAIVLQTNRQNSETHYETLGVPKNASIQVIRAAYEERTMRFSDAQEEQIPTQDMVKIELAYKVLSDEYRRRDYDYFGIYELQKEFPDGQLEDPDWVSEENLMDPFCSLTTVLNSTNIDTTLQSSQPWLIQIYSIASLKSRNFAPEWKKIVERLEGVIETGSIEIGDIRSSSIFMQARSGGFRHRLFQQGLPLLVASPKGCTNIRCLVWHNNGLRTEDIIDWVATRILRLPRIFYYSAHSLITDVIQKSPPHKVKVIIFSQTGLRAEPFLRQAAKHYWQYASFSCVLWQDEEVPFWKARFGIESAPAIAIMRDPGIWPTVYHGSINNTAFTRLMDEHKTHVLPQLRNITAKDLGCDASSYSRAGEGVKTWYCVIVVGRPGPQLDGARDIMRSVQTSLANEEFRDQQLDVAAKTAFKSKRLSLAWLDGEKQKDYCHFLISTDDMYNTCGPRRYVEEDIAKVLLVRYDRKPTLEVKRTRFWDGLRQRKGIENHASILVANYNGSMEASEITLWISKLIEDGDTKDLPDFKAEVPLLVSEDSSSLWLEAQDYTAQKVQRLRETSQDLLLYIRDSTESKLVILFIITINIVLTTFCVSLKRRR